MRVSVLLLTVVLVLSACVSTPVPQPAPNDAELAGRARQAVQNFAIVVDRVEPVAEQVCRERTPRQNCDFGIFVDRDPRSGVNAFQTVDPAGRPAIIFTLGLIAEARNTDELAFIMGHEAGHHIAQHLLQQQARSVEGARVFSDVARQSGANARQITEAAQLGSFVASRQFGQQAELEADAIGTAIALRAGFDPLIGAEFFTRIPDPDDPFLSTHPPNAARVGVLRGTVRQIRNGGGAPGT